MKKFTLFFLALCVSLSVISQNAKQLSEKMFQKDSRVYQPTTNNPFKFSEYLNNQTKTNLINEGFEGTTFPPTGWTKQNLNANPTYQWKKGTSGYSGSSCAMVEYDITLAQQNEWLITPTLDLTQLTIPVLELWWSMSYYWGVSPNNNYDFFIKASTNGGSTWTTIWKEDSAGMFASFSYQKLAINLSNFATSTNFKLAFQYIGSDGAALYLDEIVVGSLTPNRLDFQSIWSGFVTFDAPFEWSGYTQIPFGQSFPVTFAADIKNTGAVTQNNVTLTAKELTTATTANSNPTIPVTLAFNQNDTLEVASFFTLSAQGSYSFALTASSSAVNPTPYKDTAKVVVNNDVVGIFSRDNNSFDGWRTWNGTTGGNVDAYQIANLYEITNPTKATSISFVIASGTSVGSVVKVLLYEGWKRQLIAESNYHTITLNQINQNVTTNPVVTTLNFNGGYPQLYKDSVYFAAVQAFGGSDSVWLAIGSSNQQPNYTMYIYDTDNLWYYYPKGSRPSMIRLNTSINANVKDAEKTTAYVFQNIPNPAKNSTRISYQLNKRSKVSLEIYDITGRKVMEVNQGTQNEGVHNIELNVSDLSSGTYFYTLKADEFSKTLKMIVQ